MKAVAPSRASRFSLEEIYAPIEEGLRSSERHLVDLIRDSGGPAGASALAVARGGKRVRPALFLAAHLSAGNGTHEATHAAACRLAALVEGIHLSSLLHDDVLDKADLRRGVPTVNGLHGDQVAILAGDLLYAKIFIEFLYDLPVEVVRILSLGARRMIEGEIRQTLSTGKIPSEAEYLEAIRLKTAAFFAAVAEGGAAAASVAGKPWDADERAPFRRFGEAFGMAFQIVDDVLDWTGSAEVVGKRTYADLSAGKATLPLILYLETAGARGAEVFARTVGAGAAEELAEEIRRSGALERSAAFARAEAERAGEALAEIPEGPGRDVMGGLLDFLLRRDR